MSEFDFRDYLSEIVTHYANQRHLYTLTDVLLPLEARWSPTDQRSTVEREEDDREKRVEQFPVLAGLRRYALGDDRAHVLLAGRPGSGKSTALRQLVVEFASDGLVPVLVQLKGDRTVPELIKAEFRARKVRVTDEQIEDWLVADRLILLLDGVNEMPTEELRRSLAQFREDNRTVPMIFTTRDLSLGGDLGIGKRLEMKPLSEGQLREFVGKYLPEQGEKLLGQLRDRLREISETPLLLKMLCDVFGQTGEIPPNKGELFRLFDREYEKFKSLPAVSADFRRFKSEILQHLAFVMMQGDESKPTEFWLTIARSQAERSIEQWLTGRVSDPGVRAKEWLEDLLEHHLLQVAADGRRVEFHHQLFQEYYAAEWLLGMFADRHRDVVEPERFQHFYLNYLKWTESVAIVLSLMEDEKTAVDLVEQALDVDLMLGARLAGEVRSDFQEKTVGLVQTLQITDWLIVELLDETKSDASVPILLERLEIPSSDRMEFRVTNALANIASEAAINGLLKVIKNSNSSARSNAAFALERISPTIAILDLVGLIENDINMRQQAARILATIASKTPISDIIQSIKYLPEVYNYIVAAESDHSEESSSDNLHMLEDSNKFGCGSIVNKSDFESDIPNLLNEIEDSNSNVRAKAAATLGALASECMIPSLLNLLEHPDWSVRWRVTQVLGKINSDASIFGLCKAVEDSDPFVRRRAVQLLGEIGSEIAIPILLKAIEDLDLCVCKNSIVALGEIGSEKSIPNLLNVIEHPDADIRRSVIEALGEIGSGVAIPNLLKVIEDSDLHCHSAAMSLGKLKDDCAAHILPNLLKLLPNESNEAAFHAIQGIQANCKFYNYEIFHFPPAKPQPTQQSPTVPTSYQFPNVTEVKIIEHIDNYHASPPRDPPP